MEDVSRFGHVLFGDAKKFPKSLYEWMTKTIADIVPDAVAQSVSEHQ